MCEGENPERLCVYIGKRQEEKEGTLTFYEGRAVNRNLALSGGDLRESALTWRDGRLTGRGRR